MTTLEDSLAERLRARPEMRRVPSPRLDLFIFPEFLPPQDCGTLIELIEANRRPSTLANSDGDPTFRTSETCDLDRAHPGVATVDRRFTDLSGIDPALAEPLQGQRYEVGQEFKAHTDYFEPDSVDFARFCSVAGQRTWTFMVYLNDVPAGGATRFREIDKIIQPEAGKLLAWNNARADGSLNPATMHHAMKVRRGRKYVITRWYRERPWGW